MESETITTEVVFKTRPEKVYEALMYAEIQKIFTGAFTDIQPVNGLVFTAYDGYIEGRNLDLVPEKRIVQEWRATEENWPENHFSKLEIELQEERGATRLKMTHSLIPKGMADAFRKGWEDYYWEPMKVYFKQTSDEK